jgi:hypothetical protein
MPSPVARNSSMVFVQESRKPLPSLRLTWLSFRHLIQNHYERRRLRRHAGDVKTKDKGAPFLVRFPPVQGGLRVYIQTDDTRLKAEEKTEKDSGRNTENLQGLNFET